MIFLDLHKVYDALERDRCLDILEGYGMGPQSRQILGIYWDFLLMVLCIGGYYGTEFQGFWGVTYGYPLSPTIINVVVDSVVRHWLLVMADQVGGQDGHRWEVQHQSALLYADGSMVASSDWGWLQRYFSTPVGLFNWLGLGMNVSKTVGIVLRPCQAVRTQLEAAYERNMAGAGISYWERQKVRVWCSECGE